ncbi:MAG: hypothetical protein ACFFG0_17630 [Candidatus Thorarchaeota archaeon]
MRSNAFMTLITIDGKRGGVIVKKLAFFATLIFLLLSVSISFAEVRVRGYHRKDGTYVKPHYRTNPNNTIRDNYSTWPNVNPHTGKQGTINPYKEYNPYKLKDPYNPYKR